MLQHHIVSNRITSRMHYRKHKTVIIICAFDSFGTVNISPTMVVTVLWHCRVVESQLSSSPTLIVAYLALPSIIYHRWLVAGWVEPSLRPNAGGRLCYSMVSQCVASVFGCWHAMGNTAPTCLGAPSIYTLKSEGCNLHVSSLDATGIFYSVLHHRESVKDMWSSNWENKLEPTEIWMVDVQWYS